MERDILVMFDIDGTLTPARKKILPGMYKFLQELQKKVSVCAVGGSDFPKLLEQLGESAPTEYDYLFSENGTTAYKDGKLIHTTSFVDWIGEEKMQKFISFTQAYLSTIQIPKKRGNFIEFRAGMLNISPVGRSCSYDERLEFNAFDNEHKIRERLCAVLAAQFPDYGLKYSIGGQISLDVFPVGWDKRYALKVLEQIGDFKKYKEIHFFGDKTMLGGNDYELYSDERTIGHTVTSPEDTEAQCRKLFF